jgi:hypothetical protein
MRGTQRETIVELRRVMYLMIGPAHCLVLKLEPTLRVVELAEEVVVLGHFSMGT